MLLEPTEYGTHIVFVERPAPASYKTKIWSVENRHGDGFLGDVRWYVPWRCYSFYPATACVFEKVCLREIADFCDRKTKEHKA